MLRVHQSLSQCYISPATSDKSVSVKATSRLDVNDDDDDSNNNDVLGKCAVPISELMAIVMSSLAGAVLTL